MDYEKLYNEALERAKYYYTKGYFMINSPLEKIFPELKESEDEKIRKELIDAINGLWVNDALPLPLSVGRKDKWIAWLEKQGEQKNKINSCKITFEDVLALECAMKTVKITEGCDELYKILVPLYNKIHNAYLAEKQGEQKVPINDFKAKNWYVSEVDGKIHDMTYNPTDKVEPKFHEGDWIINDQGSAFQIAYIDTENCRYVFEIGGYTKEEMNYESIAFANNHYRKWTIDDAKDGDVLVDVYGNIGIFQKNDDFDWSSYCSLGSNGGFRCFAIEHELDGSHPATKEQRDLLFKKIEEAGYQWNPDKKELKKMDTLQPKFKVGDCVVNNNSGDVFQVTEIKDDEYCLWPLYGEICGYLRIIDVDTDYHLWTIADAKDGDVLYSLDSKQPFIFKHRKPNEQAVVYCGINTYGKFFIWNTKDCVITTDKYIPATKEQHDTLFKAMTEAGYQWDAKKKELKLLISNGGDFESNNSKQKPTWSEEDEIGFGDTLWAIQQARTIAKDENDMGNLWYAEDWLKSLKERLS